MKFLLILFPLLSWLEPAGTLNTDDGGLNKKLMLEIVNKARSQGCKCGGKKYAPVAPLTWDDQLEKAAQQHSSDMARRKYFDHRSKDGRTAGERIKKAGYNWTYYAENIAMGNFNEQEVLTGWLASKGHCANIMDPALKHMGVARDGAYWVQVFGSK